MDITKRIESYWDKRSDAFNELRLQELKNAPMPKRGTPYWLSIFP